MTTNPQRGDERPQLPDETAPVRERPNRLRSWVIFLGILGPGLIAAIAGNDAGGIATYSVIGASYVYSLLWALIPMMVSLAVVQEMSTRLGAVTGQGLADLVRSISASLDRSRC